MKKVKISITGMHCASCAANVERSLKTVKGVSNVSVSIMLKKGSLEIEDNVTDEDIKKAVSKAGYSVSSIEKV